MAKFGSAPAGDVLVEHTYANPSVSANGIDRKTSEYLTPSMSAEQLVATLMGSELRAELQGQDPALRATKQ